ncbi:hypothetical protein TorRG33x02_187690 [Trema orientale]|uniref:Uncharacterized protein n=1 Tax=Trema orientale TaxID=63057 RepID=A0A2P5EIX7_TREOI|nr:hypothetical protein TorRG33x02_187690 [Trema orientale]
MHLSQQVVNPVKFSEECSVLPLTLTVKTCKIQFPRFLLAQAELFVLFLFCAYAWKSEQDTVAIYSTTTSSHVLRAKNLAHGFRSLPSFLLDGVSLNLEIAGQIMLFSG